MTTYIVNGNSVSPQITLDGINESQNDERFLIVTNENCPEPYLRLFKDICDSNTKVEHRRVKSNTKKWFAGYVKSCYLNYLCNQEDRVVVMPAVSISGAGIEKYMSSGHVSIVPGYRNFRGNMISDLQKADFSKIMMNDIEPGGRMHILIDYENVSNAGLEGAEYITEKDCVTLFYSKSSENIQRGYFDALANQSGDFTLIKLTQIRKNGLDFYIAILVGKILQKYPKEKILIVSKDQGYYAILDYCEHYADMEDRIKFAASIETGIVMLDGDTARRSAIINSRGNINLESEYDKYQEKKELYKKVSEVVTGTSYAEELDRILGLVESKETPKELYTASLHTFGAKRGQEVYRLIKKGA